MGCREISEGARLRTKVLGLLDAYDASITPSSVLFPKLPLPAQVAKTWNGLRFYWIIFCIATARKKRGGKEEDALQVRPMPRISIPCSSNSIRLLRENFSTSWTAMTRLEILSASFLPT